LEDSVHIHYVFLIPPAPEPPQPEPDMAELYSQYLHLPFPEDAEIPSPRKPYPPPSQPEG